MIVYHAAGIDKLYAPDRTRTTHQIYPDSLSYIPHRSDTHAERLSASFLSHAHESPTAITTMVMSR
jgi:hypothetical protein